MGKLLLDTDGNIYLAESYALISEAGVEERADQAKQQIAELERVKAYAERLRNGETSHDEPQASEDQPAAPVEAQQPAPVVEQPEQAVAEPQAVTEPTPETTTPPVPELPAEQPTSAPTEQPSAPVQPLVLQ